MDSSSWSLSGGLSTEYQGVGASTMIGYTKRRTETVKKVQGTCRPNTAYIYSKEGASTSKASSDSVEVALTQRYQRKECRVKDVKLIYPNNVKVKCKFHDKRDANPHREKKDKFFDQRHSQGLH